MAASVQLVLVIHNHQPVGNFDHVIHEACDKAYLPFLRMLLDFPGVRMGLHTSGCLLEWLQLRRPEYFELVRELLSRGQLELLGGGMQEPILPVIPQTDAHQQLASLQAYLSEHFGDWATGMWTPERVWEPQMAQICGSYYRYTLLDDFHFEGNALPEDIQSGYFSTEFEGQGLKLLPISQKLRYTLPFRPVQETFDYLRELMEASAEPPLVVFGDDGEKFGVWPDTYEWVYEKGWLRDFFSALQENSSWVRLQLPAEMLAQRQPAGRVFIPCRSYKEMGEWARLDPDSPADSAPGHWRSFLAKYPEIYDFYRRMCSVSRRLSVMAGEADGREYAQARAALQRAQCNCAYWHGVFGGVYLNYLRAALTGNLLEAEQLCNSMDAAAALDTPEQASRRRIQQASPWQHEGLSDLLAGGTNLQGQPGQLRAVDGGGVYARLPFSGARLRALDDNWGELQLDASPELLQQLAAGGKSDFLLEDAGRLCAWFDGAHGLCLRRLDYYPTRFCWTDVLARRREHYHHKVEDASTHAAGEHESIHDRVLLKEEGLEQRLLVDPHQRVSFVSCFGQVDSPQQFLLRQESGGPPQLRWRDYGLSGALELHSGSKAALSCVLEHGPFTLRKSAALASFGALELQVRLESGELPPGSGLFWLEFNLTVLTDTATDRWLEADGARQSLSAGSDLPAVRNVALVDQWQQARLELSLAGPARLLSYPVYTVSSSEGGFEKTYQGTCIMLGYQPDALREGISLRLDIGALGQD
ncbi:DUF1926 domain-containing protein [bacterium]|nr:DUF1926 domain-containing protein [bacterium]